MRAVEGDQQKRAQMRVYRRKYTHKGITQECAKWYVEIRDHNGAARRMPAFRNRKASEAFGSRMQSLIAYRVAEERPDVDLLRWFKTLPARTIKNLLLWGILDGKYHAESKPLREHAGEWYTAMVAKGDGERHASEEMKKVLRIIAGCGFDFWPDISANTLQNWLADLRKIRGRSIRTSNAYLGAFKAFVNWAVRDYRLTDSPLKHLSTLNVETDRRRERRALTADEMRRLMDAAIHGPRFLSITGPERALLYCFAVETGFRVTELRSLTSASFDLEGNPPTVTVSTKAAKNRRKYTIPLRPAMAEALRDRFAKELPGASAFNIPDKNVTARMIRIDLEAGGIPYIDAAGEYADFHALRHTFGTNLSEAGVLPKIMQELMRHSRMELTMKIYTHTQLEARSQALKNLPDLKVPKVKPGPENETE